MGQGSQEAEEGAAGGRGHRAASALTHLPECAQNMALARLCQPAPDGMHGQGCALLAQQHAAELLGQLARADGLEAGGRGARHQACCQGSPLPPGGWHAGLDGMAPEARREPGNLALPHLSRPRRKEAACAGGMAQPVYSHGYGQTGIPGHSRCGGGPPQAWRRLTPAQHSAPAAVPAVRGAHDCCSTRRALAAWVARCVTQQAAAQGTA
mmetsp:Transcript_16383/g.42854  ORF Transcript_16383/g.42854 Transcript_16383/m.42854 type:complete len:210 (+) Transcript_16383:649-1278(+)